MNKPFFSIIVPSLNEGKYLPLLLDDLSNQTFKNFEVILVDGKSEDQTVIKAKSYQSKINLKIINSDIRHVCVQRNLGASHANSDILIFSDADNRLPTYFLQGIKYRWEILDCDLISPYFEPDLKTRKNETIANAINLFFDLQMSIKPSFLLESLVVVSTQVFNSVGGFDQNINYAEGKSLIQHIDGSGYICKVIKDPTYIFSFRRLRKYGVLSIASRVAQLELIELLGPKYKLYQAQKLYPMLGGTIFDKPKKAKNKFLKNITKLLKDF